MKLIIDIPEEEYELVRHGNKSYTTELELMNAVANGTPLPKGHGRLIDINDIEWARHIVNKYWYDEDTVVSWDVITDAPTIVEEESEEEI